MPKAQGPQKMVARIQEKIDALQERLMGDPPPTPEEQAALTQEIEAEMAQLEKFQALQEKLDTLTGGKKAK